MHFVLLERKEKQQNEGTWYCGLCINCCNYSELSCAMLKASRSKFWLVITACLH